MPARHQPATAQQARKPGQSQGAAARGGVPSKSSCSETLTSPAAAAAGPPLFRMKAPTYACALQRQALEGLVPLHVGQPHLRCASCTASNRWTVPAQQLPFDARQAARPQMAKRTPPLPPHDPCHGGTAHRSKPKPIPRLPHPPTQRDGIQSKPQPLPRVPQPPPDSSAPITAWGSPAQPCAPRQHSPLQPQPTHPCLRRSISSLISLLLVTVTGMMPPGNSGFIASGTASTCAGGRGGMAWVGGGWVGQGWWEAGRGGCERGLHNASGMRSDMNVGWLEGCSGGVHMGQWRAAPLGSGSRGCWEPAARRRQKPPRSCCRCCRRRRRRPRHSPRWPRSWCCCCWGAAAPPGCR